MNIERLKLYDENTLNPKQHAAAQKLPIQQKNIIWTEEEEAEFSKEQKFLVLCRCNGATYSTLRDYFNLGGDNVVVTALKKTALGYSWKPHLNGGSFPILSDIYVNRLKKIVNERCLDLNAMKTVEVMDFFHSAVRGMYSDGYKRLIDWGCFRLAQSLRIPEIKFVSGYLTHFARRCNLFIKSPEVIEQLRRQYCNRPVIHQFFSKFSVLMHNVSPYFVYNVDETGLSTKRAYKVFTTNPLFRATPAPCKEQHITAVCCFSATGDKIPLMMILAGIRNIPFINDQDPDYYACSPSGWMSQHLFNVWSIIFISHIQRKRALMSAQDRLIPFILFLDGHASRMSPFALRLFNKYNIIVVVFPAHTSHVLQPFDVSIAAPLKSSYIRNLLNNLKFYTLYGQSQAMQARYARVRACIDAWSSITPTQCMKAFNSAGIYPFNEGAVAMDHLIHPNGNAIYEGRTSILSSNNITDDDFLQRIPAYVRRIQNPDNTVVEVAPEINYEEAQLVWNTSIYEIGKICHPFPQFPSF